MTGIQLYSQSELPLPGIGQQGMCEPWREIAGGVNRVAGRAAKRQPDPKHQHADQQWHQAAAEDERKIDVAGLRQRLCIGSNGQDTEDEDGSADDLANEVRARIPDSWAGCKHPKLGRGIGSDLPMW